MSDDQSKKLDKLETKIDRLDDRLDRIDITLVKLTDSVVMHERRSTAAEANLEILKQELDPIKEHVQSVNVVYKVVVLAGSALIGFVTIASFVLSLFK